MMIIKAFNKALSFIPRKINLFKEEERRRTLFDEKGTLTQYHLIDHRVNIGEYTYGVPKITEYSSDWTLQIGRFCCISNDVEFIFGGQHHYDHVSQYAFIPQVQKLFPDLDYHDRPCKSLVIGNDVWIGKNVTVLAGATIGDGAVIGTNSVIRKDVPPYAIVIGNPAQIIKYRFNPDQVEALIRIKWWDWPLEKIQKNIRMIMSPNIDEFISGFDPTLK